MISCCNGACSFAVISPPVLYSLYKKRLCGNRARFGITRMFLIPIYQPDMQSPNSPVESGSHCIPNHLHSVSFRTEYSDLDLLKFLLVLILHVRALSAPWDLRLEVRSLRWGAVWEPNPNPLGKGKLIN